MKEQYIISLIGIIMLLCGCKKQDEFLNAKRLQGDVTPQTVADFQAILDFAPWMTNRMSAVGLVGTDNLYLDDNTFSSTGEQERNLYSWQSPVWTNGASPDWTYQYANVEYANVVLDGLKNIEPSQPGYNNLKGQALFYRSLAFYTLAQIFCKQYDASAAGTDLGLPLRTTSDVNVIYQRSSLQQTYQQMISDASQSISLLDEKPPYNTRPSLYAAEGLLAKIYLVMQDYTNAGVYANKGLSGNAALLDYNNSNLVSTSNAYIFPANGVGNPEILFYANQQSYDLITALDFAGTVSSDLYNSYSSNDLRKSLFYSPYGSGFQFTGCYSGDYPSFCGIANDEIYLIRAECYARNQNTTAAMADLNTLLKNRYKSGTFNALTASSAAGALQLILQERRKELSFTGNLRWEDLRRLNKDPNFQVTLKRVINGTTYTLPPNDPRYVLPIPDNEIQQSGIKQN